MAGNNRSVNVHIVVHKFHTSSVSSMENLTIIFDTFSILHFHLDDSISFHLSRNVATSRATRATKFKLLKERMFKAF